MARINFNSLIEIDGEITVSNPKITKKVAVETTEQRLKLKLSNKEKPKHNRTIMDWSNI